VSLNWGTWVQTVVNFLIVAFCIFVMIRFMQNLRKKKEEEVAAAPAPAPEPTKEEVLLTEIRDLLKEQQKK
jgi:large conductance mechanosensitive channel